MTGGRSLHGQNKMNNTLKKHSKLKFGFATDKSYCCKKTTSHRKILCRVINNIFQLECFLLRLDKIFNEMILMKINFLFCPTARRPRASHGRKKQSQANLGGAPVCRPVEWSIFHSAFRAPLSKSRMEDLPF